MTTMTILASLSEVHSWKGIKSKYRRMSKRRFKRIVRRDLHRVVLLEYTQAPGTEELREAVESNLRSTFCRFFWKPRVVVTSITYKDKKK